MDLIDEFRSAVRFDFRARLHLDLDDVGGAIPFGHAIDFVNELLAESGTHLHAARAGWNWPSTWADVFTIMHAEHYYNVNRDREKSPEGVSYPMPWPDGDAVSAEELADYQRRLAATGARYAEDLI